MPGNFLDLRNERAADDGLGLDMPDGDAAKERAFVEARETICSSVRDGEMDLRQRIDVRDETGTNVSKVTFEHAVKVSRAGQRV